MNLSSELFKINPPPILSAGGRSSKTFLAENRGEVRGLHHSRRSLEVFLDALRMCSFACPYPACFASCQLLHRGAVWYCVFAYTKFFVYMFCKPQLCGILTSSPCICFGIQQSGKSCTILARSAILTGSLQLIAVGCRGGQHSSQATAFH